jgi:multiple sugar transport system ATP-binding protein
MRTEIKKLYKTLGKTTVYVTHDQVEAMTLASRIAVMHQGRLQQFAEPKEVYERPANMFVAGFMGSPSMNFLQAESVAGETGPMLSLMNGKARSLLPLPAAIADRLGPGRKVVLGVRPEHLTRHDPDRPARAVLGRIDVPVEVVEPTGAETIVIVKVGEREVVARCEPDSAPREGETVTLAVDMGKACLFDPETERLI